MSRPHDVASPQRDRVNYSMLAETKRSLDVLLQLARPHLPSECIPLIRKVQFRTANTGSPYFPCPFKETEATSALKAVEAGVAAALADLALGRKDRRATVDLERSSAFLFSAYLSTIGGMDKQHPKVKTLLKGEPLSDSISNRNTTILGDNWLLVHQ